MVALNSIKKSWRDYFFNFLGRIRWTSLLSVLVMLYILSNSIHQLHWIRNSTPLFGFAILGALCGLICSITSWKQVWCILYNLLLSIVIAMENIGNIWSFGNRNGFNSWLESINWQIFLFFARVEQWIKDLSAKEIIGDDGFWTFIFIILIWVSSAWLVIWLKRKKEAWIAIFPILSLVAYFSQNGRLDRFYILLGLFYGVTLVANHYFNLQEDDWKQRKLDSPDQLWMNWSPSAIVISALVLGVAFLAPTVTTPEGWREIRQWVDEMRQPNYSETSNSNTSGIYVPENLTVDRELPTLPQADVSEVGVSLPIQDRIVLWVRVGDTTLRPWRIAVFDTYTGKGWLEAPVEPKKDAILPEIDPVGRKILSQHFTLAGPVGGKLFAAAEPVTFISEGLTSYILPGGDSFLVGGDVLEYELVSYVPDLTNALLQESGGEIDPKITEIYLQLPQNLPDRVRKLAQRLTNDEMTYYEKVIVIQNYVRNSVPYDLQTAPPMPNQDVVDYFLFEAKSGFCTYYASAMAVLLRLEGIPARVATGYAPGTYVKEQGSFLISGDSAHAWVEVYFPDYGWISFEPTPSQEVPLYAQVDDQLFVSAPKILTPQEIARRLRWLWGFIVLCGVLVLFLAGRWIWKITTIKRRDKRNSV
ncbi:MAG: transglutaminase domain-containing protein, partial [Anaerolineaceae bacterium]|nr:transglutaminase domain-containing protein [Anaerolineaceae bacterium]